MLLDNEYNIDDLPEDDSNFELLPAGWYDATISEAEVCITKSGSGQYVKLRLDIFGPTHEGRCVFSNININNHNPKAEEIGRKQLGAIMRALGLSRVKDTDQLIGGNLKIKVGISPAKDGYEASNQVKAFKSPDGSQPPAVNQQQPPQTNQPPAGNRPPWQR